MTNSADSDQLALFAKVGHIQHGQQDQGNMHKCYLKSHTKQHTPDNRKLFIYLLKLLDINFDIQNGSAHTQRYKKNFESHCASYTYVTLIQFVLSCLFSKAELFPAINSNLSLK